VRRSTAAGFLTGLWAGILVVSVDALAGRLFPERFGVYDPIGVYRLSEPVGYWNALGTLAAFGLVLALCLGARSESLLIRLAAAGSTVPLALTLYFTFSRGAWLSLFAGLVAVLVLDPRRLQVAGTLLVVAPWPALAVGLATRSGPLTETGHSLASASVDGHALAATAAGLALAGAAAVAFAAALGLRVHLSTMVARLANATLAAALLGSIVLVVVALGGPVEIAHSFAAPPRAIDGDLDERLFDLSGNGRVDGWRVALDAAGEHPVVGSGGGSYERYWLEHRPYAGNIRDAHSLYLEVLGEYGPLGLVLVAAVFAVPLGLALRFRRLPFVPAAAGVVVVYVAHAAVDWDWEFPVLTLVALACAAAIVGSATPRAEPAGHRRRAVLLALLAALAAPALVGALGARAEAASEDAFAEREYGRAAADARTAERLVPWSTKPLLLLGRARARAGDRAAAREAFRRALEREPASWRLWYELAAVSRGAGRRAALREARSLNPLERLLDELEDES
jgi:O-antigen ligase